MPIDINLLRKDRGGDPDKVKASVKARFRDPAIVDEVLELDALWIRLEHEIKQDRKANNLKAKEIGKLRKAKQDTTELQQEVRAAKEALKAKEAECEAAIAQRDALLKRIGNLVHESVPVSNDEADCAVVASFGEPREKTDDLKHHHELMYMIGAYEPEPGVVVAGHRGYFLTGPGVLLNQALLNYGLSFLMNRTPVAAPSAGGAAAAADADAEADADADAEKPENKNYIPMQPPYFMNQDVMAETAQLEEFDEALYKVTGSENDPTRYLIATSEQPISAFHRGQWLTDADLPKRYAGISTCFRKEAGSHGKDAWGLFRVHQFEKIEQFVVCQPDDSWKMHEEMLEVAQEFYQSLGLPYHVINIVSGELNNAAAKKLDLEAWFPTLGVYRELVSCSNCTDYQARAMETRYGHKVAEARTKDYVHMLNATLCATERTMCCIVENYQTPEGVIVPEVLRPYMGGMEFMPFVREPLKIKNAGAGGSKSKKKKGKKGGKKN